MGRADNRTAHAYGLVGLVALIALAYLPLFVGQVLFQRDITRQIYPEQCFLHDGLAGGDLPYWNPLIGLGISTPANPLNQHLYPPNLVSLLLHSPPATSFFLFAHLLFGAVGVAMLLARLRPGSRAPAIIAGVAWALSGYVTSEVTAGLRLTAVAYFPWCALGALCLSRRIRSARATRDWVGGVAWLALPLGCCFLTGEVFFPILAVAFAVSVAIGEALAEEHAQTLRGSRRWWFRLAVGLCAATLLAGMLASAVLWPAQRAAEGTDRGQPLLRAVAEVGSLHPWRLVEMVAPSAMGDPYTDYPAGSWVGEKALGDRPLLYGCYLGSSVLVLALMAFGRNRRLATALGIAGLAALLVALGRHTPAHAIVRFLVPPLARMRGPEKYLSLFFACTAILAGLGLARVREEKGTLWLRGLLVVGGLLGLVALSGAFPSAVSGQIRSSALRGLTFATATTVLVWMATRSARAPSLLLVALTFVDLASAAWPLQNFAAAELVDGQPAAARSILADARARGRLGPPRVYRAETIDAAIAAAAPPTSVADVQRNLTATLIDNHAGCFGIASVPGYDAAMPSSLSKLWLGLRGRGLDLLRMTGVDYVVLPSSLAGTPGLVPMMDPVPGARLFRVDGALPRVYLARPSTTSPYVFAPESLLAPEVVAGKRAVLAPANHPLPEGTNPVDGLGSCRMLAFASTHLEAECDAKQEAVAVFLEQYDPGWTALLDGRKAQLLRANLTMRAVAVPAGRHSITLDFSPPGLLAGCAVSFAGLLALVGIFALGRRRCR
jgi:hypothetical protein